MPLSPLDRPGAWTFDDLVELPDDGRRWEVVDGTPIPMTPPTVLNELISLRLFRQLDRQAPPDLEVVHESGIRLGDDGRVPDLAVLRTERTVRRGQVGTEAADAVLLVEVVSASSRKNDRFFKPIEYAMAGVPYFWRVELEPELFVVTFVLEAGAYVETGVLRGVHSLTAPYAMTLEVPALMPPQLLD